MSFENFNDLNHVEKYSDILNGNSVLALQFAILKAMSNNEVHKFLNPNADKMPVPLGNVIGGGAHFKGNASSDFQEFLLIPRSDKMSDNAFANEYVHKQIGRMYPNAKKTMEGAYALNFNNVRVLDVLKSAIKKTEKELGFKIDIGIDVAASSLFKKSKYNYKNYSYSLSKTALSRKEQVGFINKLILDYGIEYVEDPLQENDFNGFKEINASLVCGDDLVCTNIERLEKALGKIDFAKENKIIPVISHRSGETMDNIISHLAVGFEIPYIKLGIYGRERTAKIKELIKIEKKI